MRPSAVYTAEQETKEKAASEQMWASLSDIERKTIADKEAASKENVSDLSSLPTIALADISRTKDDTDKLSKHTRISGDYPLQSFVGATKQLSWTKMMF